MDSIVLDEITSGRNWTGPNNLWTKVDWTKKAGRNWIGRKKSGRKKSGRKLMDEKTWNPLE